MFTVTEMVEDKAVVAECFMDLKYQQFQWLSHGWGLGMLLCS